MKQTRLIMDMPITVEIIDEDVTSDIFSKVFAYFQYVDETFSPFKETSELSRINQGKRSKDTISEDMKTVFALSEETKRETDGYFDMYRDGNYDPCGIVKGWAINHAAIMIRNDGFENFYIEAGGDIQVSGRNAKGKAWTVGIRNPFNLKEIVKVLSIQNKGVATSGTYERGDHIYNPKSHQLQKEIVSLTVIGPTIYDADRFATAAFAMGKKGIEFIEKRDGLEGYQIDRDGIATFTSGFSSFVV